VSSKFSNNAVTGTLVPRNTHAPLTLSGCLSIASKVSHPFIVYSSLVNGKVTFRLIINWQLSESGYPGFEDLQDLIDHYMLYSVNMLGISR
jgi:hypothetical protein